MVRWLAKLGCGHVICDGPATPEEYVPARGAVLTCPTCLAAQAGEKAPKARQEYDADGNPITIEEKLTISKVLDVVSRGPLPDPDGKVRWVEQPRPELSDDVPGAPRPRTPWG